MNFLAHIYLSGDDDLITIGNFIADGIRGKTYKDYPKAVQIGILLHRQIDTFTDSNIIVKQSTKRLHKNYGHYSGVIVDILYDHYLAKNWTSYSQIDLEIYTHNFYDTLENNLEILPMRIKRMMPHMISDNWLLSYANIEGIQRVLEGMNRRTQNKSQMNKAVKELQLYYDEFENEFTVFFEELRLFSNQILLDLKATYNYE
ncbi:acyl carrier protein phosphodiesterase [Ichthyenterobacterium sp. W332]|uniref:Acyl carrier protein phosphodiesterase n=1 Tax=Microcosmobacter mediterraneus TaxID=3075607 RepID=A0ABU2YJU3_9FLAO|nr:acyl carrier protein phosphodiesterase [Ichthyenterobacterium sp. W332]MDT0557485.1 acyl carrier protein phosphodiesterase [Ichthyenterobacterium sp. W332]